VILEDIIEIAKEYDGLGWALQEQLQSVLDGEDLEDQNENALSMCRAFLRRVSEYGVDVECELALFSPEAARQ
jgi:hypothetical protein